jgi:hypothetical protein
MKDMQNLNPETGLPLYKVDVIFGEYEKEVPELTFRIYLADLIKNAMREGRIEIKDAEIEEILDSNDFIKFTVKNVPFTIFLGEDCHLIKDITKEAIIPTFD